jgi:hypothetical protein
MSSYRDSSDEISKLETPTKRVKTGASFTTPIPFTTTAAEAHMLIDAATSQSRAPSTTSSDQFSINTLSKAL